MNSFIRTASGLSIVVDSRPYTVESDHPNFPDIVAAVREKRWAEVPNLVSVRAAVKAFVESNIGAKSNLTVDVDTGNVLFRGDRVNGILVSRIIDMARDAFDLKPMELFLANLYENPSNKAVEQLYGWMEANGITITEDGHLLAFKRVRDDFKSFFDGETDNSIGTTPELPRNKVDDRSEVTCSHGLHFCSQSYLPEYHGGLGKVLLLKINPRDVVSIPTDYNFAKGRACKYTILDELKNEARQVIEVKSVLVQPVVADDANVSAPSAFKRGYEDGYKDGRGKKANGASFNSMYLDDSVHHASRKEYEDGYQAGRKDGRNKAPKLYASEAPQVVDTVMARVFKVIADQLGVPEAEVVPSKRFIEDMGADSLDVVELVMGVEDEFSLELADNEVEMCVTVADAVALVKRMLGQ